jgi:hypothetical protein
LYFVLSFQPAVDWSTGDREGAPVVGVPHIRLVPAHPSTNPVDQRTGLFSYRVRKVVALKYVIERQKQNKTIALGRMPGG